MSDADDSAFRRGLERGLDGASSSNSIFDIPFTQSQREAQQRGFEQGSVARATVEKINNSESERRREAEDGEYWSNSSNSTPTLYDRIVNKTALIGASLGGILGLIYGLTSGFQSHGIGGAILYGLFLGVLYLIIGGLIGIVIPGLAGLAIGAGALWLAGTIFMQLWDLGKPTTPAPAITSAPHQPPTSPNRASASPASTSGNSVPMGLIKVATKITSYEEIQRFTNIVTNALPVDEKLSAIDTLLQDGFDLNSKTSDGNTPINTIMDAGAAELVAPLIARGLNINASARNCADQYWYAQSIAAKPRGIEVLAALSKAGFREDCLKSSGSPYEGFICGVLFGRGTSEFNVGAATRAVHEIASMGFDVNAMCLGKTIVQRIEGDESAEQRLRLAPIAEAVKYHASK